MRIARQALASDDLAAEVVELRFTETALDERACVNTWRGVSLEEDLIAGRAVVLPAEEVVEADLIQTRGGGVRRQMTADPLEVMVRADDHRDRVPADEPPDPELHLLVAGEVRLLLRRDRVDVPGLRQGRESDVEHPRPLEQLVKDEASAIAARLFYERIK